MFSFKRFFNSFKFAYRGLRVIFKEEQSFLIQLFIGTTVFFAMFYLHLSPIEKVVLIITVVSILILELLNTVVERVLDIVEPNHDPRVGKIKDMTSAIVLFASLGSVVIGVIVFAPYIQRLLE